MLSGCVVFILNCMVRKKMQCLRIGKNLRAGRIFHLYYRNFLSLSLAVFSERYFLYLRYTNLFCSGSGVMANTISLLSATQNGHNPFAPTGSPEPEPAGHGQSRIDKWKAKHEAMLKAAEAQRDTNRSLSIISIPTPGGNSSIRERGEDLLAKAVGQAANNVGERHHVNGGQANNDQEDEGDLDSEGGHLQDKQGKLVITMSDKEEEFDEDDEEEFEDDIADKARNVVVVDDEEHNSRTDHNNINIDDFRKENNDRLSSRIKTALVV